MTFLQLKFVAEIPSTSKDVIFAFYDHISFPFTQIKQDINPQVFLTRPRKLDMPPTPLEGTFAVVQFVNGKMSWKEQMFFRTNYQQHVATLHYLTCSQLGVVGNCNYNN